MTRYPIIHQKINKIPMTAQTIYYTHTSKYSRNSKILAIPYKLQQSFGHILSHHIAFRNPMIFLHVFPSTVLCRVRFTAHVTFKLPLVGVCCHVMAEHVSLYKEPHAAHRTFIRSLLQMDASYVQHQIGLQIEFLIALIAFDPLDLVLLHHMPRLLVVILEPRFAYLTNAVTSDPFMLRVNMSFLLRFSRERHTAVFAREARLLLSVRGLVSVESKAVDESRAAYRAYEVPVVHVHVLHQQFHVVKHFRAQTAVHLLFARQLEGLEVICYA